MDIERVLQLLSQCLDLGALCQQLPVQVVHFPLQHIGVGHAALQGRQLALQGGDLHAKKVGGYWVGGTTGQGFGGSGSGSGSGSGCATATTSASAAPSCTAQPSPAQPSTGHLDFEGADLVQPVTVLRLPPLQRALLDFDLLVQQRQLLVAPHQLPER